MIFRIHTGDEGQSQFEDLGTEQVAARSSTLADDLTGQGHTSGNSGDEPWVYPTIQLP
ncbi:MAG: hypothetical protein IIC83_05620 [Chloroflexi bacterium]|nr:hypothetical protein [Chloroflexota bacterium]